MEIKETTMGTQFKMMVPGGWWHFEFLDGWFFATLEKQEEQPGYVKAYCPTEWSISSLRKDFLGVFGTYAAKRYPDRKVYLYPRYGRQLTLFRKFFWANADRKVVSLCLRTFGHLTLENYNSCTQGADSVFQEFEARFGETISPKNREDWMFLRTKIRRANLPIFLGVVKRIPEKISAEKGWAPWKKDQLALHDFVWFSKDKKSFEAAIAKKTNRWRVCDSSGAKGINENYRAALKKWLNVNDPLYALFLGRPEDTAKTGLRASNNYSHILQAKRRINELPNWVKRLARKTLLQLSSGYSANLLDLVVYLGRKEISQANFDRWIAFWQKYLVAFSKNETIAVGGQEIRLLTMYRQIEPQDLSPGLSLRRTIENVWQRHLDEHLANNKDLSTVVLEQPFELVIEGWDVEFYSTLAQYYSRGQAHSHCLGGYFDQACKGIVAVFGLVDPEGNQSTIQFELEDSKWVLIQHRGKYNSVVKTPEYTISGIKQPAVVLSPEENFDPFEGL